MSLIYKRRFLMKAKNWCLVFVIFSFFGTTNIYSFDLVGKEFWNNESDKYGSYIKFEGRNNFSYIFAGAQDGGVLARGTYTVNDNEVILNWTEILQWASSIVKKGIEKYTIVKAENSLFSEYKLVGNGKELWGRDGCRPPKGKRIKWNNLTVISFWDGKRVVIENARIREGPGTNYNYRTFEIVGYEVGIEQAPGQAWWDNVTTISSVPSGKTVEIMAHSEKKETIDGIEEYWYYCRFYHGQYSWEDGWIWGGLLKK